MSKSELMFTCTLDFKKTTPGTVVYHDPEKRQPITTLYIAKRGLPSVPPSRVMVAVAPASVEGDEDGSPTV